MLTKVNKLALLLTLLHLKVGFCLHYLLIKAKGGSLGCIAISYDNDYHYNVVNIIMTFHFENRFLQGLKTMEANQKAIFLIVLGLIYYDNFKNELQTTIL